MFFRLFSCLALLTCLFGASGCSTFNSRSREKQAVFQSLDAATQTRLQEKKIEIGDTEDMVYIALGQPNEKQTVSDEAGDRAVWIYTASWQEFQGMAFTGYRREIVPDGKGGYRTVYLTEERPVYAEKTEDRFRIEFTSGKVSVIEAVLPADGK